MPAREASSTAVLVCQGRAVADGRLAPGRFADPIAIDLLRDDERAAVMSARSDTAPSGWRDRLVYERLRASSEVMAARTVAIDDALAAPAARQLVVLGAGLDDRAWRMRELSPVTVFEVDRPASQADKRDRLNGLPPVARHITFLPVDFAQDDLDAALAAGGHDATAPTVWLWEGVIPYLTRPEIEATLTAVGGRSAPGSRLVLNYQTATVATTVARLATRVLLRLTRQPDPAAREPWRSRWRPSSMRDLLARHGWVVDTDRDLLTIAAALDITSRNPRSLASGRVAIANRS